MRRRRQLAMLQQARVSDLLTVAEEERGRPLVAGGFFAWEGTDYEEAWMLINQAAPPRPRALVEAVSAALMSRPATKITVALIDMNIPKNQRFAAFLGFESVTSDPVSILGREFQLMIWRR
jgi:hypothetical protein